MTAEQVLVLEEAANDLGEGMGFYESRRTGLGFYFFDSILSDIESLYLSAGVHAVQFGFHRLLSRRFPFAIYYSYDGSVARVVAILDMRRNPAWTHDQLSRRK